MLPLTGRVEAQMAGARHVLVVRNIQEGDYGTYMCYATNSLGSKQQLQEVRRRGD